MLENVGNLPVGRFYEDTINHMKQMFPNRETLVLHEIVSKTNHVDIHVMFPCSNEPYFVLFTTGMSDIDMNVPNRILQTNPNLNKCELVCFLPDTWSFDFVHDIDHYNFFPINNLINMAKFPFQNDTWLGHGHTIPNFGDYTKYTKKSKLSCALLLQLDDLPNVVINEYTEVGLLYLYHITKKETEYMLEYSLSKLMEKMDLQGHLDLVLNPRRKSRVRF